MKERLLSLRSVWFLRRRVAHSSLELSLLSYLWVSGWALVCDRFTGALKDAVTCSSSVVVTRLEAAAGPTFPGRCPCLEGCARPPRPGAVVLTLSPSCVNSLTPTRPNTRLHRTAPTPAAPQAPTPRTGASSPSKAWSSQPTTPEATGLATMGPGSWGGWPPVPVPRLS